MKRSRLCGSEAVTPTQMRLAASAEKGGWRLLVGRQQPRHKVEEDHYRPRQKRGRDEGQPDYGRIDTGIVGKSGGDAHHLGIAPVDQETSVHFFWCPLSARDFRRSAARWRPKRAEARRGTHRRTWW